MKHSIFVFSIAAACLIIFGCEQEEPVSPQRAQSERGVALAKAYQAISGNFTVVSVIPKSAQPAGNDCMIDADVVFSFTGSLSGSFSPALPLRIVHRGPCVPLGPASETFQGQGTYSGTVATAAGAFDFNFRGSADALGNAQAQMTLLQGTGGLSNLRGNIILTGVTGVGGTYSGTIGFDP